MRNHILSLLGLIYVVLWVGGVVSYAVLEQPPLEARWAAPAFLFVAALIVLLTSENRTALLLLFGGVVGWLSEIVGVHTGYPYGRYFYTETMRPLLFDVPLVMVAAWIILPAYIRQLLLTVRLPKIMLIVLSAVVLAFIDLLIDPVAIGPMDFWVWKDYGPYYGIPMLNFIGWFIVGVIIFSFLNNSTSENRWHTYVGTSVILFFTCIAFSEELFLAAIAGSVVVSAQLWLCLLQKQHSH